MIINTNQMLLDAQTGHYAVGAFNVENMEFVQAVIEAAEEMKSPVILATSIKTLKYATPETFIAMMNAVAQNASVPVALHLDHAEKHEDVLKALKAGYKSIMFDGSKLDYADNLRQTEEITKICKSYGASVEGELGPVGGKPGDAVTGEDMYTKAADAVDYVKITDVDSLAVAIGTAHGVYKETPKLDYERLQQIRRKLDVPLVLHGASGLTEEQTRECIEKGICKVNISTELRTAWTNELRASLERNLDAIDPKIAGKDAREAVKKVVKEKIRILGSEGKA